jgi:glycosyltransferase involved in cell wall biosynthesis
MERSKVDITVLILCYNAEKYISECIHSALNQVTSYSMEIIVVDDCSSDSSWSVIESIAQTNTSVIHTFRNEKNLGSLGNLKYGLSKCSGRYIAYLEGDDYWTDETKIEHQIEHLGKHKELIGIGGGCTFVDAHGQPTEQKYYTLTQEVVFTNKMLWNFPPFQTSTFVFRNMAFDIPDTLPDQAAYNDKVLYLFSSLKGDIAYLPKPVSAYRYHEGNLSHHLELKTIYKEHIRANTLIVKHLGIKYGFRYLRSVLKYRMQYLKTFL